MLCMCPQEEAHWAREWQAQGTPVQVDLMDARNSVPRFLWNTVASSRPFNMDKYRRATFEALLRQSLADEQPDVVHFDSLHTACYLPLVRQLAPRALCVLRCHNAEHVILGRLAQTETHPLKRALIGLQARRLHRYEADSLAGFDLVLAITEADAQRFRAMCPAVDPRMIIVPAGADIPAQLPAAPPETAPVRLVHVAAMDWLPNQTGLKWFLQSVLPLVERAGLDYHLDVIGKGMPDEFKAFGSARVTVHGFVEDLRALMSRAHLAVVPLQVGGGMRVKILDYWAAGIPVVATSVGAEGLTQAAEPVVAVADEPAAFAEALLRLGRDAAARERLRRSAFDKVSREYGWPSLVDALVQRYRQMGSSARGAVRD